MRRLFASLVLSCLLARGASGQITAAVAASVQFAMEELKEEFRRQTGMEVKAVYGSSGKLTTQIRNGAPFDLLVSADMDFPDSLHAWGHAAAAPKPYAYGKLVLWSMKDLDLSKGLAALADPAVGKIALADPERAPYGRESVRALKRAGLYDKLKGRLVLGESISQVSQYVLLGSVDAGFGAKSVVLAPGTAGKGRWVEVDSTFSSTTSCIPRPPGPCSPVTDIHSLSGRPGKERGIITPFFYIVGPIRAAMRKVHSSSSGLVLPFLVAIFLLSLLLPAPAAAQDPVPVPRPAKDSTVRADSVRKASGNAVAATAGADTAAAPDSLQAAMPDSLRTGAAAPVADTVTYSAVRIRYRDDRFSLADKALLTYRGSSMVADSIVYWSKDNMVEAMGAPLIEDPTNPPILGYKMRYNLKTKVGEIYYGSSEKGQAELQRRGGAPPEERGHLHRPRGLLHLRTALQALLLLQPPHDPGAQVQGALRPHRDGHRRGAGGRPAHDRDAPGNRAPLGPPAAQDRRRPGARVLHEQHRLLLGHQRVHGLQAERGRDRGRAGHLRPHQHQLPSTGTTCATCSTDPWTGPIT